MYDAELHSVDLSKINFIYFKEVTYIKPQNIENLSFYVLGYYKYISVLLLVISSVMKLFNTKCNLSMNYFRCNFLRLWSSLPQSSFKQIAIIFIG